MGINNNMLYLVSRYAIFESMNKNFYKLSNVFQFFPLRTLVGLTGQSRLFPFYHAVSDNAPLHIKHLYDVKSVREFEKDLDFYLKTFKPIGLDDLIDGLQQKKSLKQREFLLTFDDGLSEYYDIVTPILKRKGIPSICFLNSAFVDNKELFFRFKASLLYDKIKSNSYLLSNKHIVDYLIENNLDVNNINCLLQIEYSNRSCLDGLADLLEVSFDEYLEKKTPYMTTEQINKLIADGFHFGAHSIDHPKYCDLTFDEQLKQIKQSVQYVSSTFNQKNRVFSFPFTDYGVSKKLFDMMYGHYEKLVDLSFGCAGIKKDSCINNIQRIPVEIEGFSARQIIYGEYLYFIFKAFLHKNTIVRK